MAEQPQADDLKRRIGAVLREKRSSKKVSQAELAKAADLSRTSLNYIEQGKQECGLITFMNLASALGEKAHVLLAAVDVSPRSRDAWVHSILAAE